MPSYESSPGTFRAFCGNNDSLFGGPRGAGDRSADIFVFNAPLVAATNVDTITGFEANALDRIALDPAVFAAVAANGTSALDSGEFRAPTGPGSGRGRLIPPRMETK